MWKQYFKQAIQSIRENPLVSTISIAGTALAIAMIMVVVLLFQIKNANYEPETKRDRMLYVQGTRVSSISGNSHNNGSMSSEVVKECFYNLKTPEAVTASHTRDRSVSLPDKRLYNRYTIRYTDPGFWNVFEFRFLNGYPFSQEDFTSGLCKAVVTERFAREIFGTKEALGKTFVVDFIPYTITGIVRPVSLAARDAYGDIWVPYTSNTTLTKPLPILGNMAGPFTVSILAKNKRDFDIIKEELKKRTEMYNAGKKDYNVNFMENPITKFDIAIGSTGFQKKSVKSYLISTGSLLLFLLLLPALNLTGVVQSSVQKRREEIGTRKAFGANQGQLVRQILYENLILTLIGALFGLLLSFAFLFIFKSFLLNKETSLTWDMLFKPELFATALLFTILLNFFSAGIPAWRIARQSIVESLNGQEK
ncbi:ABC transporter permease [Parabacteroides sp. Marseille-P3160]|uniref:ABC transporter permease n=1 Tax=Parabacteroides sp. Marseille-P3160 TaxID=1917887 RepID=UPI0009BA3EFE|nr:ABC transporter permease [Parabacteroides sp. Marseille-P3160]